MTRCEICGAPLYQGWPNHLEQHMAAAHPDTKKIVMDDETYLGAEVVEALRRYVGTSVEFIEHYARWHA
jgi:hypothetical protein